jgi:hypothetical protein
MDAPSGLPPAHKAGGSFHKDLESGIAVERKVLGQIKKKYPCAVLINGFKGYDIWIPEIHKSVEVKADFKSNETGNVLIEIEMNGKPSALTTTKADWWVFYDGTYYAYTTPYRIRNFIESNGYPLIENLLGYGDKATKKAYLLPKLLFFRDAIKIIEEND